MRGTRRALLVSLAASSTACRPRRDLSVYTIEDPKGNLLGVLNLGDAKQAAQLKSGFHQIEEGAWRWTEPKFTVELRAPFGGQKIGATLVLRGAIPNILYAKTGPVAVAAKLNGTVLGETKFDKAGDVELKLDVPPAALRADTLLVEFTTTPGLAPESFPGDGRSLGLIVSYIALEKKSL